MPEIEIDNNKPQSLMRRSFLKSLSAAMLYSAADIDGKAAIMEKVYPGDKTSLPGTLDTWYPRSFFNAMKVREKLIPGVISAIEEDAALLNAANISDIMPSGIASYRHEAKDIARFIAQSISENLNDAFCLQGVPDNLLQDPAFKEFAAKTIAEGKNNPWLSPFCSEKQVLSETKRLYNMRDRPQNLEAEIMQRLNPVIERIERLSGKIEEVKKESLTRISYSVHDGKFQIRAESPKSSESWRKRVACNRADYVLSHQGYETVRHLVLSRDPSLWVEQANWGALKGPDMSAGKNGHAIKEEPKPKIIVATPDMVVDEGGQFRTKTETRRLSFSR